MSRLRGSAMAAAQAILTVVDVYLVQVAIALYMGLGMAPDAWAIASKLLFVEAAIPGPIVLSLICGGIVLGRGLHAVAQSADPIVAKDEWIRLTFVAIYAYVAMGGAWLDMTLPKVLSGWDVAGMVACFMWPWSLVVASLIANDVAILRRDPGSRQRVRVLRIALGSAGLFALVVQAIWWVL